MVRGWTTNQSEVRSAQQTPCAFQSGAQSVVRVLRDSRKRPLEKSGGFFHLKPAHERAHAVFQLGDCARRDAFVIRVCCGRYRPGDYEMRKYIAPVESRPAVLAFASADRLKLQTYEH